MVSEPDQKLEVTITGNDETKNKGAYLLTSSDHPGLVITHVQLKAESYDEWAQKVQDSLRAKKKTRFIDGCIEKPVEDSDKYDDWLTINSMIVSWIFNTIEPKLSSTISYVEEEKTLWDDIQQRFSIDNDTKVHQIKSGLSNCHQDKDSIAIYYGKLKKLWDEQSVYDRLPSCTCHDCKCGISAKLEKRREDGQVHDFLMGLNRVYNTVRSSMLMTDPLPTLNKAYSILIQEEGMRGERKKRGRELTPWP